MQPDTEGKTPGRVADPTQHNWQLRNKTVGAQDGTFDFYGTDRAKSG